MGLLNKVKAAISNDSPRKSSSTPESTGALQANIPSPTPNDLFRYRSHHGANLGSIFVLEKWLYPSMFEPDARGDSELAAVTA